MSTVFDKTDFDIPGLQQESALVERSDEQLLSQYRDQGDRAAFETLVHRYEKELYSYLSRYLNDATLAEDVFQATFLQVHLKCHQFESDKKVRPWLYTVATNQAIDSQRRNKRHRMLSLDRQTTQLGEDDMAGLVDILVHKSEGPDRQMESAERVNWIRKAVAALPDALRSAVTLIYYQGLKYREAADILAVPVGTVKSRLHTAILKLNEAWQRTDMSQD